MSKMKKILAILLAVCFVLSVTAASASAGYNGDDDGKKKAHDYDGKKKLEQKDGKKKFEQKDGKKKVGHKKEKKTWKKGCYEKKKVPHFQKMKVGFKYIQIMIIKIIMVWIPGCWTSCFC